MKESRQQILAGIGKLISSDRNKTHGSPHLQFWMAQTIKGVLAEGANWPKLNATERESVEMIVTKLSRIASGTSVPDHYKDIAGYAGIAAEGLQKGVAKK